MQYAFCIVELTVVGDAQHCELLRWPAVSVRGALSFQEEHGVPRACMQGGSCNSSPGSAANTAARPPLEHLALSCPSSPVPALRAWQHSAQFCPASRLISKLLGHTNCPFRRLEGLCWSRTARHCHQSPPNCPSGQCSPASPPAAVLGSWALLQLCSALLSFFGSPHHFLQSSPASRSKSTCLAIELSCLSLHHPLSSVQCSGLDLVVGKTKPLRA